MAEPKVYLARLSDLQPSQLYISQEKLSIVTSRFVSGQPDRIEPIPIKDLDGLKVMTDGHTRALAAYLAGSYGVPVYDDPDALEWEAYRICVAWCHAEGIFSIADLAGRVIDEADYERLWYDRCRVMQSKLAKKRLGK